MIRWLDELVLMSSFINLCVIPDTMYIRSQPIPMGNPAYIIRQVMKDCDVDKFLTGLDPGHSCKNSAVCTSEWEITLVPALVVYLVASVPML